MHDRASPGRSPRRFLAPVVFAFACSLSSSLELRADERLEGIACRSVHLGYDVPEGDAFYTEIRVVSSAPGTYFCTNGFRMGYFGIQELANGNKLVIFSVWDPGQQNDPNVVEDDRRVRVLHQDPGVRVKRFGNEGTGGQSFFDYDWKIGETYKFLVQSRIEGERTVFSGYFWLPEEKRWKHLVSFATLANKRQLRGYYSFVEDFRRNRRSTRNERRAVFGNGWVRSLDGRWHALTRARFTADRNPVMNIDAGIEGDAFFLATGGDIENDGTSLWSWMNRPPSNVPALPASAPIDSKEPEEKPAEREEGEEKAKEPPPPDETKEPGVTDEAKRGEKGGER